MPTITPQHFAVVGAGPAGLAFSVNAAKRGHKITLFDNAAEIGGQFNMAKQIPGKEEFFETLRYYQYQLHHLGVELRLNTTATAEMLKHFDKCIIATGIVPRQLQIEGITHPKVLSYIDVLKRKQTVGHRVAIIGAGGIGFDVAEYLSHCEGEDFYQSWGIDIDMNHPGGIEPPHPFPSKREIYLLQRKKESLGKRLGKTTGWIHRQSLKKKGVQCLSGVSYKKIDDKGLHIERDGKPDLLQVDNVIVCAGQESHNALVAPLEALGKTVHVIGGAFEARELDARFAIEQATRLADKL